jgi:hypothetical protein
MIEREKTMKEFGKAIALAAVEALAIMFFKKAFKGK